MNRAEVDAYRENLLSRSVEHTILLAKLSTRVGMIDDNLIEVKTLTKEQNGRVRKNTNKIFFIYGVGSVAGIVFGIVKWLY